MFKSEEFNKNVDYCEYVFYMNIEYNLGLNSNHEIQQVANLYVENLDFYGKYSKRDVVEDDLILFDVVKAFYVDLKIPQNKENAPSELINLNLRQELFA